MPTREFVALGLLMLAGCSPERTFHAAAVVPTPASAPTSSQPEGRILPSSTNLPAPTLASSNRPVLSVYHNTYGRERISPSEQLDTAIWSDGRIVWRAGGSLNQAQIEPRAIEALLHQLHKEGVFGNGKTEYNLSVPDGEFEVIEIRLPDRELRFESCHELFEQNTRLVATSHGIESLAGRVREEVLAAQPEEHRRFRRIWSEIRTAVASWTPTTGEPYDGPIPLLDD